jgi:3'(2'), 5'-bisphosphate nucleotidase
MTSDPEVKQILEITRKAGKLLKKLSLDPSMRQTQRKPDGSPVTQADLEVSQFLVDALKPLGHPVISEEDLPDKTPDAAKPYFLVDPLDGTKYFARGEDEFAICVGFLKEGKPFMGAIFDPTSSKMYWAQKGVGAFCDDKPITHTGPNGSLRVYSSGFHNKPERQWIVDSLNIGEIREKGSALKFCDIAAGEIDLYMRFGPTSEWDTAAAQVLLEEAGCVLFEMATLSTMTYGKDQYLNRGILACHHSLIDTLVAFLRDNAPLRKD